MSLTQVKRVAMTCNGPGEFAGWVRPLVRSIHAKAPEIELHCFFVPDDYATGRESSVARDILPMLTIHEPGAYLRFAAGAATDIGRFAAVLYLGGDVMHAGRIHARLGGALCAYRYAPRSFAKHVALAFALDEKNRDTLTRTLPLERVHITGNLAVDGALAEAAATFGAAKRVVPDGVVFLPGSRKAEIANLFPFFATAASRLRRLMPELPISFGISPFTEIAEIERAFAPPVDARAYAQAARVVETPDGPAVLVEGDEAPFALVRDTLQTAIVSQLAVTIPGTKCIELAALGVPTLACTPFNMPEKVVINGPLTYLDRLPVLGMPLKRVAVMAFAGRFRFFTQPNIDADEEIMPELAGTLTPGAVAASAAKLVQDAPRRAQISKRLRALYALHIGAVDRMSDALIELVAR